MLRELDPHAGDTVLELAAGPGDTGFEALRLVGEHGFEGEQGYELPCVALCAAAF